MSVSIDLPAGANLPEGTTITIHTPLTDDKPNVPVSITKFRRQADGSWTPIGLKTYGIRFGDRLVSRALDAPSAIESARKRNGPNNEVALENVAPEATPEQAAKSENPKIRRPTIP